MWISRRVKGVVIMSAARHNPAGFQEDLTKAKMGRKEGLNEKNPM